MGIENEMLLSLQQLFLEQHEEDDEKRRKLVDDFHTAIGYRFQDPILLQQAFTHESYREGCSSLDRLEYVGDAFMTFATAYEHYLSYPDLDPGMLTRLRAVNVDTEKLARAALKHELHKFLRHNILSLELQIKQFRDAIVEYPLHSSGLVDAPKVLADIMESLVGAIYIDSNSMDTTWKVAKKMLEPLVTPETLPVHPVTRLHEMCEKNKFSMTIKDLWRETGEIEFAINGQYFGRAKYSAKRAIAKNRAALNACNQILEKLES